MKNKQFFKLKTLILVLSGILIILGLIYFPLIYSDNISKIEFYGSGESVRINEGTEYTLIKNTSNNIPLVKLELHNAFGAKVKIFTQNKQPAIFGFNFIQPGQSSSNVNCNFLISEHAKGIWRSIAHFYHVPQAFYHNGDSRLEMWFFDTESELKPGIWTLQFCGKKDMFTFGPLLDFKFNIVEPLEYEKLMLNKHIENCNSGDFKICSYLGIQELKKGNLEKSFFFYKKACDGNEMNSCLGLGNLLIKNGNSNDAKEYFKKVCEKGIQEGCKTLSKLNF